MITHAATLFRSLCSLRKSCSCIRTMRVWSLYCVVPDMKMQGGLSACENSIAEVKGFALCGVPKCWEDDLRSLRPGHCFAKAPVEFVAETCSICATLVNKPALTAWLLKKQNDGLRSVQLHRKKTSLGNIAPCSVPSSRRVATLNASIVRKT